MSLKSHRSGSDEPVLDIYVLMRAILWACLWAVPFALLVAAGAYYYLSKQDPVYRATASVLIEIPEVSGIQTGTGSPAPDASLRLSAEAINSKVQLIRSRDLARAVVERMGLADVPEFRPDPDGAGLFSFLEGPASQAVHPEEYVLDQFSERLSVYPIDISRVIFVEFESRDPVLAATVANGVLEEFLRTERAAKQNATSEARLWLENEISILRNKVVTAETSAEQFRSRAGLFATATDTTLPEQQLASLSQSLVDARARESQALSALKGLERVVEEANGNVERLLTSPTIANQPLIQTLRQSRAALEAQIADLSADLLPRHPRLRALYDQRAELDRQIARDSRSVLTGLQQEADRAQQEVAELEQLLSAQKLETGTAQQNEVELRALEREARAERELLETMLTQYRSLLAREGSGGQPAEARMIETASPPIEPSGAKTPLLVALAALVALLLSLSIIVLRELLSGRALGITEVRPDVQRTEKAVSRQYEDRQPPTRKMAA